MNFKNQKLMEVVKKVKEIVHEIDPAAKVYLFGSMVKSESTAMSDIDILVVTKMVGQRYEMMVKVYRSIEEPIELHIITDDMLEKWYRRFIPDRELIKV